jgi:hypothetical protein
MNSTTIAVDLNSEIRMWVLGHCVHWNSYAGEFANERSESFRNFVNQVHRKIWLNLQGGVVLDRISSFEAELIRQAGRIWADKM